MNKNFPCLCCFAALWIVFLNKSYWLISKKVIYSTINAQYLHLNATNYDTINKFVLMRKFYSILQGLTGAQIN